MRTKFIFCNSVALLSIINMVFLIGFIPTDVKTDKQNILTWIGKLPFSSSFFKRWNCQCSFILWVFLGFCWDALQSAHFTGNPQLVTQSMLIWFSWYQIGSHCCWPWSLPLCLVVRSQHLSSSSIQPFGPLVLSEWGQWSRNREEGLQRPSLLHSIVCRTLPKHP